MRIVEVKITPSMARDWLAIEPERNQRTLRQRNVEKILHAINTGDFRTTHQPVALDPGGYVLDGRHRLTAIAAQRKSVTCLVAYNADPATFDVIDTGASRSPGDSLKISGYNDVNVLGAATRQVLAYPSLINTESTLGSLTNNMTTRDILHALEDNEMGKVVQDALGPAHRVAKGIGRYGVRTSATAFIALIALYSKHGPEVQDEFFDRLSTGAELKEGSPILTLRNWLITERSSYSYSKISGTYRPTAFMVNAIRAWNDYVNNQDRHTFRMVHGRPGVMPEVE
jgi:hypothetical protein